MPTKKSKTNTNKNKSKISKTPGKNKTSHKKGYVKTETINIPVEDICLKRRSPVIGVGSVGVAIGGVVSVLQGDPVPFLWGLVFGFGCVIVDWLAR